jgi:hypothetical protein
MKFVVAWLEERTSEIDAIDMSAAEKYGVEHMSRLGGFPSARLLSITEIKPNEPKDDKPPTPFGKPPSGTLGGGQMKVLEALPDAVAVAA